MKTNRKAAPLVRWRLFMRHLVFPFAAFGPEYERKYQDAKYREMRPLAVFLCFAAPAIMSGLWIWDYLVDPAGSVNTLPLRLAGGALFVFYGLSVALRLRPAVQFFILTATCLANEWIFLMILGRLERGLFYGLGGYLYFYMGLLVAAFPFRFRSLVLSSFLLALFPNLVYLVGLAEGLSLPIYNVYVWFAWVTIIFAGYFADRTLRKKYLLQREIEEMATTDALTGLCNRRYFLEKAGDWLELARRYGHAVSAVVVDIDRFKSINDNHGHAAGDRVLAELAGLLRRHVRRSDVVGRIGGDEFVLLFPEMVPRDALALAEKSARWSAC